MNHKDSDKTNNRVDNLEYVTPAENVQHAYENGIHPKRVWTEEEKRRQADSLREAWVNGKWPRHQTRERKLRVAASMRKFWKRKRAS